MKLVDMTPEQRETMIAHRLKCAFEFAMSHYTPKSETTETSVTDPHQQPIRIFAGFGKRQEVK